MLRPEDLVDLAADVERAQIKVGTQQILAAERFLLRLATEGGLPSSRAGLERYLGPIFCSSARDQAEFGTAYREWLRKRFPGDPVPEPEPPPPPLPVPRAPRRWPARVMWVVAAIALGCTWVGWQHWRPRAVEGTVFADERPADGARVTLLDRSVLTDRDGHFKLRFRASELPQPVRASAGERIGSADLAPELLAFQRRLYLGAPLAPDVGEVRIDLAAVGPELLDLPPVIPRPSGALTPELVGRFDASTRLQLPTNWQRVRWGNALFVFFAPLAFALWYAWYFLFRRPVLQRRASRTPRQLAHVHLPGGVRALMPRFPMRRLAQELRRRRAVESLELQVEPTIAKTLERFGMFTPVRGSHAEPDYFALVDRSTLSDHQALLAAELVADLARSDVLIERYDFDGAATTLRRRETHAAPKLHPTPAPGRSLQPKAVAIDDLRERYPEHRVLVFGDGAGCFDGYTGKPASWLETLKQWPVAVLLTPVPQGRWGARELALMAQGIQVLPLDADGLAGLVELIGGTRRSVRPVAQGRLGVHERTTYRWLERNAPPDDVVGKLCDDLRSDLGERGFVWLAACAAYPEIHWGITLRLGAALVPDQAELQALLPRVTRQPWLRAAYMPDWLRIALLEKLPKADELRIRAWLRQVLETMSAGPDAELPLRISPEAPPSELSPWRRLWRAVLKRLRRSSVRPLLRQAGDDSPLRDYVFLSFLSGRSLARLDLAAPGALAALLRASRRAMLGPAFGAFALSVAAAGVIGSFFPPYDLAPYAFFTRDLRLSPDGTRAAFVASVSAAAPDGTLRTFEQRLVVMETRTGNAATVPVDGVDMAIAPNILNHVAMQPRPVSTPLAASRGVVRFVQFSDDASLVAVGYDDGKVRLWRLSSISDPPRELLGHTDDVVMLAFSKGGARLASASLDGTVHISTLGAGAVRLELGGPAEPWGLAFSNSGDLLATAGGGRVSVWEAASGRKRFDLETSNFSVRDVVFSPDGARLAIASSNGTVILWEPAARRTRTLSGHREAVAWVSFSADGRFLASIDQAGTALLWDPVTGEPLAQPLALGQAPSGAFRPDLAISDDSLTLVIASGPLVQAYVLPRPEPPPQIQATIPPAPKLPPVIGPPVVKPPPVTPPEKMLSEISDLRQQQRALTQRLNALAERTGTAELGPDDTRDYERSRTEGTALFQKAQNYKRLVLAVQDDSRVAEELVQLEREIKDYGERVQMFDARRQRSGSVVEARGSGRSVVQQPPSRGSAATVIKSNRFDDISLELSKLFDTAEIRRERAGEVQATVARIVQNRDRYEKVAQATGVPWYFIAIMNQVETGGSFERHLHNGDPLKERTTHVPAGRPVEGKPPFTWEESAIDALRFYKLDGQKRWQVADMLFQWERTNGFGYRLRQGMATPYVWSCTQHYEQGAYVADMTFSPTSVVRYCGAAALLRGLINAGAVREAELR